MKRCASLLGGGFLAAVVVLGATSCTAQRKSADTADTQRRLLKNWTLCRCLARASGDPINSDAARSAAAYLETSTAGIDVYERLEALGEAHLARPSSGSVKGSYDTIKCIDLYHGAELDAAVRQPSKP